MKILKIEDRFFNVEEISTQLSIGSHGTINVTINTFKYPDYYKFFTDIFDNYYDDNSRSISKKSEISFNLQFKNIRGYGCLIKSLDIDSMNYLMYLSLTCDYLKEVSVQEKRDEVITDLLNDTTSNNKNNIN